MRDVARFSHASKINTIDRTILQRVFGREVSGKVTSAKIAYCLPVHNTLVIGCASEFTEKNTHNKVWTHVTLKMNLRDQNIELVSSQQVEQAGFGAASIVDLNMEARDDGDYSQVACVWNHGTMENKFIDLNLNCQIIDR